MSRCSRPLTRARGGGDGGGAWTRARDGGGGAWTRARDDGAWHLMTRARGGGGAW